MNENYKYLVDALLYKIQQIFGGKHSIQIKHKHMASI